MRHAIRGLLRTPGLTALIVICIAIGIAGVTTMSAIVDALLFRAPPHVEGASQIRRLKIHFVFPGAAQQQQLSDLGSALDDYLALYRGMQDVAELAAYTTTPLSLDRGADAAPVSVGFAGASFFSVLGVKPALGHWYLESRTDGEDDPAQAVLSNATWRRRFGGARTVIGETVRVGQGTYRIVAVAPPGFRGIDLSPVDVWLPLGAARQEIFGKDARAYHGEERFQLVARLKSGMSDERARTQASAVLQDAYVNRFGAGFGGIVVVSPVSIIPARAGAWSREAVLATWLSAMAGLVLLIACGNVAGLLLVRATRRRREMALRLALGARRIDLVTLLGCEGLAVASAGGLAGILMAAWAVPTLERALMPGDAIAPLTSDWRVLAAAVAISAAIGVACSVLPAVRTLRADVRGLLAGASTRNRPATTKLRGVVLAGQVTLATTLTAGAALFLSSWWHLKRTDLGVAPEHALVARAHLSDNGYTDAQTVSIYTALLTRLRALPGVHAVSIALTTPLLSRSRWPGITVPGAGADIGRLQRFDINAIGRDFFASTGTMLLEGRDFTGDEGAGDEPVAIINARFKHRYWPTGDPVGQCIGIAQPGPSRAGSSAQRPPCVRIVGVAQNTRTAGLRNTPPLQVYVPLGQWPAAPQVLILNTTRDATLAIAAVRHAISEVDSTLPYVDIRSLSQLIAPEQRPWLLAASLFSLFSAIALALAAVGIYGSFSYFVSLRSHELGIRLALGSSRSGVVWLIARAAAGIALPAIVVGLLGAFVVGHVMTRLLVDTSPTSPLLLASTATSVFVVAMLAVLGPAYRAATLDPVAAIRQERAS